MIPVEGLFNPLVENHCAKRFHPEVTMHSSFLLVAMIELVSYASMRDPVSQEKVEKEGGRHPVSTSCFHPTHRQMHVHMYMHRNMDKDTAYTKH